jgi:hypothetical protein
MQLTPQVQFSAVINLCAVDKGPRARQWSEAWSLGQQVDMAVYLLLRIHKSDRVAGSRRGVL